MRVGSRAFLGGISRQQESRVIDEVVAAATELARHRMGALICFEQDANLDEFVVGQGTPIDANVQRELLVGIFVPESLNKLHDGAVVIRNLRIAKAGVFFPMPDTKVLDKSLGSRHRAALGITEETDAVVVVVSEERGTISFCFNGNIISNLDGASLRQALLGLFGQRTRKKKGIGASAGKRSDKTQTGSFRISLPPSGPAATGATTGSIIVTPIEPSKDTRDRDREKSDKEKEKTEVASVRTPLPTPLAPPRPMQPAPAIDTPKAHSASEPRPMPSSRPPTGDGKDG
jgi:hypothetical protein